ncbi:MAG TPA: ribose-phosphate pyrophosphokinase [Lachnospiraceae bacterium]|nr:ribose-phosphate pyrophosphokinase [Lachnospiraceae bacterium]
MTKIPFSDMIPVAPLKIYAHESCRELGIKVNDDIIKTRKADYLSETATSLSHLGYQSKSYLLDAECPRFGTGEAKAKLNESVRGNDLYIMADITNHTLTYNAAGNQSLMSPDDIFQDVKRIIAACNGKPYRITVILPFLYENRQNRRNVLESLDCASALQELMSMGIKNIITFDAHDATVQNAIPIQGFDNFVTGFQFIRSLLATEKSVRIEKKSLMVVSPDDGGMSRAVYYANVLGVDMGMFYKRRNYTIKEDIDGKTPILSYEFLGNSLENKDVFLVDDMIDTGNSILKIASELKKRKARNIYIAATYGLFSSGLSQFDEYYEKGIISRIFTTNLTHVSDELKNKPYYTNVDLSKYISLIINTLNHDTSVNEILSPTAKIQELMIKHRSELQQLD